MRRKSLAIVGNGMASTRLLEELLRRESLERYDVTVFGEEPGGAYNRILLSRVFGGAPPDDIVTKPRAWYADHGVRLVEKTVVRHIDPARKSLRTSADQDVSYDLVVLATGSQPLVPPIEGMTTGGGELRDGVFVYRTMDDCLRMRSFAQPGDSAVVLGGGLLGLEAAKVLSDLGLHVTVVDVAKTLMPAQLDPLGGEMLATRIEQVGIFVRNGRTVEAIVGEGKVEGVVLDDGTTLAADMVVAACGVRPRVDLARASGLTVNRGIVVNDAMATEVPRVYAIGECAEHRGRTYGLVAPAWEQAAVLADVLSGTRPPVRYQGTKLHSRLKVAGIDVASMGLLEPELESDAVLQVVEERRCAYRKLIVRGNKLVGAMLVGDTSAAAALVQAFDRDEPLPDNPLEVLCVGFASASRERLICNCNKVTDVTIQAAIAAGAATVEKVGAETGAGTGCGSCKTQIAQLIALGVRPAASAAGVAAGVGASA